MLRNIFGYLVTCALALCPIAQAHAQTAPYPSKPIRIVVPYPPGGFNDTLGRTLAQKFAEGFAPASLVDNKPGGNTFIGVDHVAKSAPDGYTILIVAFPYAVLPALFAKLPFDPVKDLQPVIQAAATANMLVVNNDLPVNSVKELIALAKAKPGSLNYASTGNGSSNHISMELFKTLAQVDITHIPYKGSAPAVTDTIGGQVNVLFDNIPNVLPHVKAGKLKGLAVTGSKRAALIPELPTVAEAGVPGYELYVWFGVLAPAGVPKEIIVRLNAEINRILQLPDVRDKFLAQGVETVGGSPERWGEHLKSEMAKWGKVVRDAGVKPE